MHKDKLKRALEERHVQLIALGGTIGVGLFYGSGSAIKAAGPALLLVYLVVGIFVFFILRALGEVAVDEPVSGSFAQYAHEYLGAKAGFVTGWAYWFMWVATGMAEITAVGIYMRFWFPDVPSWIFAFAALLCMTVVNMIAVRLYGEFEFWFALIKIIAIVAMLIMGALMIVFGIGNGGVATGISNLWQHGGFFANGFSGFLAAVSMAAYAYLGIEMIGITAGEAKNPQKTLSTAIDRVFWRISIFYVGSLFVIMAIYPWDKIGEIGSPFVATFQKLGISGAAGIINFVVLTAALSSCNGGLFSTGRMLYGLSKQHKAPAFFHELNSRAVPAKGVIFTSAVMLLGVVINYFWPGKAFSLVTEVATIGALWAWLMIVLVQLRYRKLGKHHLQSYNYKMPFSPWSNYLCIAFLVFVVGYMLYDANSRPAALLAVGWFALLYLLCFVKKPKTHVGNPGK